MKDNVEDNAHLIQKIVRMRILIKRTHFEVGHDLYVREKNAIKTLMLIDAFLDDRIYCLINIYNKKSLRLLLPTFEELRDNVIIMEHIND